MNSNLYLEKDGFVWSIPLMEVVINRANYYADLEASRGEDYTEVRDAEIAMGRDPANKDMMVDWFSDNMNITDIPKTRYRMVRKPDEPNIYDLSVSDITVTEDNPYS